MWIFVKDSCGFTYVASFLYFEGSHQKEGVIGWLYLMVFQVSFEMRITNYRSMALPLNCLPHSFDESRPFPNSILCWLLRKSMLN